MRISNVVLDILIRYKGESDFGCVDSMRVLRLALDLKDAREEITRLRGEINETCACMAPGMKCHACVVLEGEAYSDD